MPGRERLASRIDSFERAFRMQMEASDAFDISGESEATRALYGVGQAETDEYARRCLIARRMAERGVRFILVPYSRAPESQALARKFGWDSHEQNNELVPLMCKRHDQPVAGLLADLKQRGLLEDTLVFWGGEFGRTAGSRAGQGGAANTTATATPSSSPGAAPAVAWCTEPPTPPPRASRRTRCTCTTSTPPCCICSASTTRSSRSG